MRWLADGLRKLERGSAITFPIDYSTGFTGRSIISLPAAGLRPISNGRFRDVVGREQFTNMLIVRTNP